MAEDSNVAVTIDGGGLKFSGKVTFRQAIEMLRITSLSEEQLQSPTAPAAHDAAPKKQKLSLRETLAAASPKTSPATIAVIAAWVMDEEDTDGVSRDDVSSRYQDARLPKPGNFSRDFSSAVAKGYLAPARGDRNKFYVTQTGRALVEGGEK